MDNGFDIIVKRQGSGCVIFLSGRITVDTSPELRTLLMQQLKSADCGTLIVDFYDVEYVDTSVLAILVETLKVARGLGKTLQLGRLKGRPRYLFKVTSLLHLFGDVADEVPSAADSAGGRNE
jgi:anti-anti-sigma factor